MRETDVVETNKVWAGKTNIYPCGGKAANIFTHSNKYSLIAADTNISQNKQIMFSSYKKHLPVHSVLMAYGQSCLPFLGVLDKETGFQIEGDFPRLWNNMFGVHQIDGNAVQALWAGLLSKCRAIYVSSYNLELVSIPINGVSLSCIWAIFYKIWQEAPDL